MERWSDGAMERWSDGVLWSRAVRALFKTRERDADADTALDPSNCAWISLTLTVAGSRVPAGMAPGARNCSFWRFRGQSEKLHIA